ncbi:MAG: glycosyltransferase family 39 protein, partial [bacterium]|nr:glycosyltransferase family 39 protein [bacterium]
SRDSAAIATLLVATTAAFQFTGAVIRNDMLPTLLSSGGIALALLALRHGGPRYWLAAGMAFGLAIAAKLNFAPLGLMTGAFVITTGGRCGVKAGILLAAGAMIGMAPMLLGWAMAPEAFTYGLLRFGLTAPHAWYAANGAFDELSTVEKLTDLLKYLAKGPALAALLLLTGNWIATRHRVRSPGRRLAIWMTIGALTGAALPTPSQVQYLMPLLPPLALALGYMLEDARHWPFAPRQALLGLLCVAALPGMLPASRHIMAMQNNGSPVLASGEAARWAGRQVRAIAGDDVVATLSPPQILGSGLRLDPRFAPGPFAYRTGWTLRAEQARRIHAMTPATLTDLDHNPPAAILVGYEGGTRKLPLRPDDSLIAYARQRGYRLIPMPDGIGRLYVRGTVRLIPASAR